MFITLLLALFILLEILEYLVFLDVILSWLTLFGLKFRPKFLVSILGPLYRIVKQYIPTRFGAFDFTPIIILLLLWFMKGLIVINFPEVQQTINSLIR